MLNFLGLLAEDSFLDLDTVDNAGWTALHRIAAFGTAAEVARLINLGADVQQAALPLRWTAIHHAVFYGNEGTYAELVPSYHGKLAAMTDERGWTLLHIAASAGHGSIARDLLNRGANPRSRSRPFMSHLPESLFKRACTPAEAAAAQGADREVLFLRILSEFGYSDFPQHIDDDGEQDDGYTEVWQDAAEILS